jgi:hypothetical protein
MPHIRRGWGLISPGTQHPGMEHEVTVIKGRRVTTFRHCKGISFELVHAAKHVGEIDHLTEAETSLAGHG